MTDYKPEEFVVGDKVSDSSHSDWGVGVVIEASQLSDLPLPLGGTLTYHPKSIGQRLSVCFADGRTRTLTSLNTSLKKV